MASPARLELLVSLTAAADTDTDTLANLVDGCELQVSHESDRLFIIRSSRFDLYCVHVAVGLGENQPRWATVKYKRILLASSVPGVKI